MRRSTYVFVLLEFFFAFTLCVSHAQTTSSVTLGVAPSPSTLGQAVTLTAAVTPGATGKVTFYDGTAILGTSAISASQAVLTTVLLPSGTGRLHAHYLGDSHYGPSNSIVVTQTVLAQPSLGLKPPNSNQVSSIPYSVVVGDFNGDGKPDMVVTSAEGSQILLGNGDGTFQPPATIATNLSGIFTVAVGDFDGDGKPDLLYGAAYLNENSLFLQFGNGDGTFGTLTQVALNLIVSSFVVADFNGDGKADIAVMSSNGRAVDILLGNGDGTFEVFTGLSALSGSTVVVADFNGDGIPDLAVGGYNATSINIWIGAGDGSFQNLISYPYTSSSTVMLVGDFNGDGKADLIAEADGPLSLFLGNGDGTFSAPTGFPYIGDTSLAMADFNGDGKPDLIGVNYGSSTVNIVLGNGDGTFQPVVTYPIAYEPYFVVVGDFNGDGKTDVGVSIYGEGEVSVLLGGAVPDLSISLSHGVGFSQGQTGASYFLTVANVGAATNGSVSVVDTLPSGFTATSISGAGWTCVLATLTCTRSDSLPPETSFPDITITANIASSLTGTVVDSATVSGGGDQNLSNNTATNSFTLRLNPSLSLTSSPNPSSFGQAVTLTASLASAATGKVTFFSGTTILGDAPVTNGQSILTTQLLPPGTSNLVAEYSGDSAYGSATSPVHAHTASETSLNGLQPPTTYNADTEVEYVAIADFNGDGKLDLVTAENDNGVAVALGNGDGTFREAGVYAVPGGAFTVGVADFNGDGIMDVAAGSSNGVYILIGNGDGTFKPAVATPSNISAYSLAIADFNSDGIPDIATSFGNTNVEILLGNGDGTLQPPITLTLSSSGNMLVADFNRDGKPDLLIENDYPSPIVLLGSGDGTFQPPLTVPPPNIGANAFAVGDFNGDGKVDIAMVSQNSLAVAIGNGDGTFQPLIATSITTNVTLGSSTVAGDFNGDGKLDLAVSAYRAASFVIAFGNGDGTFQPAAPSFATAGYGGDGNIAVADLNGDGRPDLVVANFGGPVSIFLGGQFTAASIASTHSGDFLVGQTGYTYQLTVSNPTYSTISSPVTVTDTLPTGLVATAITGTGWACTLSTLTCTRGDALTSGNSYPPIALTVTVTTSSPGTLTNRASVSYGANNNTASDPTLIATPATTTLSVSPSGSILGQPVTVTATVSSGATGKVTFRDGVTLLGVAPIIGSQATFKTSLLPAGSRSLVAFYTGDSTHATSSSAAKPFTVASNLSSGFASAVTDPVGMGASGIAMADFNGDGIADLVTANLSDTVSILIGNADGTFKPYVNVSVGATAAGVAVGDFNGDGKPDVAVASPSGSSVIVLLGNGDGTFQGPASYPAGNGASFLAVGDFNGDGIADLAVANVTDQTVSILLGTGSGTFKQASLFTLDFPPNSIAVADFNGDGKADLLTSSAYYYDSVFLGNGDGTFSAVNPLTCGPSVTLADLNGDGYPDLVCATTFGVWVELGQRDGTFLFHASYLTSASSTAPPLLIADVNGDGKLDIIVGDSPVLVLFGNGGGTFQNPVPFPVSWQPAQIIAGDFNGDGRTDLAAVNTNGLSVSVLLGVLTPLLDVSSTHIGDFNFSASGVYTLTVTNIGEVVTSGTITVVDTLPAGMTGTAISGTGWTCALATLTCTRSDVLGSAASYPPITLTVSVGTNVTTPAVNSVMASGGGSVAVTGTDSTIITAGPPYPMLISPLNGAMNVALSPTLTWSPSAGATSYDVYFGASVANVATTAFSPGQLSAGTTYYWQVAAKNSSGSNPSATWSFTTEASPAATKVGVFRQGFFWLLDTDGNRQWDDPPDQAFAYGGIAGDIPITGDWTGDGHTKTGIYRAKNGDFILDSNGDEVFDTGDAVYKFLQNVGGPLPTDVPVVGDWNGSGTTKIGIVRDGFLWLLDLNGDGIYEPGTDLEYVFGGAPGDIPVVGDWTGTGTTKIGVLRDGFLWLLDANGNGTWDGTAGGDYAFAFGAPGDVPVVGDWTGDGISKVGMFRDGFLWVLDSDDPSVTNATGEAPLIAFAFGGVAGDVPIVGKWFAPPASITATGGTPQSTPINTAFSAPLSLFVTGVDGYGVSGVTIQFTAPASGASATFASGATTAATNAAGTATSALPSANGTTGGPYSVTASVLSCGTYPGCGPITAASFSLMNTAAPALRSSPQQVQSK
jgi:uncharacterized repeat protein (TIGR01451 family)